MHNAAAKSSGLDTCRTLSFCRGSLDDSTIVQEEQDAKAADTTAASRAAPTQHSIRLRRASGDQRLGPAWHSLGLTRLLLEAPGVEVEERNDDER